MSHDRVEHMLRIGVVLVIAFAFVHVVESFTFTPSPQYVLGASRITPSPTVSVGLGSPAINVRSVRCGPAIFDAWHAKSPPSGWLGYAPLTASPVTGRQSCRWESQHRVRRAGLGLLIGLGGLWFVWVLDRRRGIASGPTAEPAT